MSGGGAKGPRKLGPLLRKVAEGVSPATPLARIQAGWQAAAGAEIAARCRPTAERDGVVTVVCESAVWAQELDLMQAEIVARLRESGAESVRSLRCRTGPADEREKSHKKH